MNETEWLTCPDPARLLAARWDLGEFASERKLRLFGVACIRSMWDRMRSAQMNDSSEQLATCQTAIEICQRLSDAAVGQRELAVAREHVHTTLHCFPDDSQPAHAVLAVRLALDTCSVGRIAREAARAAGDGPYWAESVAMEQVRQAALFRDVFGNRFDPPNIDRTNSGATDIVTLAQCAYARWRELPDGHLDLAPAFSLADALQDSGWCEYDSNVVRHLRSPGPHVPGCWVIDLLLDME